MTFFFVVSLPLLMCVCVCVAAAVTAAAITNCFRRASQLTVFMSVFPVSSRHLMEAFLSSHFMSNSMQAHHFETEYSYVRYKLNCKLILQQQQQHRQHRNKHHSRGRSINFQFVEGAR